MMTRGEFGEASSSSSSLSRSPSSPLQTPWNHSPSFYRNHNLFPGEPSSSSSRLSLRSPSDYSLSSYFSNGLCSSEDGSSQFASPPFDGMMKTERRQSNVATDEYNHDLGLCESIRRLNIREEEDEKTHHHQRFTGNQLCNLGNYEPNYGGSRYGLSSGFSPNQMWFSANDRTPNFQSSLNREVSCNLGSMGSSASKSMMEPFVFDNSLIMEARSSDSYSVPSMFLRKSGVGASFDHHQGSGGGYTNHRPSLPNMCEIVGYVYLMAKDQHGCKLLQRIFVDGTALDAMIIFNEVIPHVAELMMDPFGNYLMQKLVEFCNEEQRTQIILMVTSEPGLLLRISLNAYGTRVVQRLVESIKTKRQISLVKSALRPGFLNLVEDLNGNHVIQRCLQCLSTEDKEFIIEDATRLCVEMATHRHGCCVLQKCIAYSTGQQRENLVTEISRNSLFLAQDPYGNYPVQIVIVMRDLSAVAMVLAQLKGHYVELSMQKFSSHIVERCLTHCPESRHQIVRELVSVPRFDLLIQDPYANFVIQAALSVTKGSLHATLVEVIRPHSSLRNNPYCRRIFSRIF